MMQDRDITLDVAKGILIILVVLGHGIQFSLGAEYTMSETFFDDIVFKSIYSFHMPLFMIISGYLFYHSNKNNFKTLAASKLIAIGIPMITFNSLCDLFLYASYLKNGDIIHCLRQFASSTMDGGAMWYLFSILLNMAIVGITTRVIKDKRTQYACFFILFASSFFIPDTIIRFEHKNMFPFFITGYCLKEYNISLYTGSKNMFYLVFLSLFSVLAIAWFDKDTYIYTSGFCIVGDYSNQLFINIKRILIGLVVSYTFMQIVHIITTSMSRHLNILNHLGRTSLFIYGSNIAFDIYYFKISSVFGINFPFNYIVPILFTLFVIVLSTIMYRLFEKKSITRVLFLGIYK